VKSSDQSVTLLAVYCQYHYHYH